MLVILSYYLNKYKMAKLLVVFILVVFTKLTSQSVYQLEPGMKREGFFPVPMNMWSNLWPPFQNYRGNLFNPMRREARTNSNVTDINDTVRSLLEYLEPLMPILRRWADFKNQFLPSGNLPLPPGPLGSCLKDFDSWLRKKGTKTTTQGYDSTTETSVEIITDKPDSQ